MPVNRDDGETPVTSNLKRLRNEFCKDLCDELIVGDVFTPTYPPWAVTLALQMIRLGWTKPGLEKVIP